MLVNVENREHFVNGAKEKLTRIIYEIFAEQHPYAAVVREVSNMYPDGFRTYRKLTVEDGNALRCRAIEHAEKFLGIERPYYNTYSWAGWLPSPYELDYVWDCVKLSMDEEYFLKTGRKWDEDN